MPGSQETEIYEKKDKANCRMVMHYYAIPSIHRHFRRCPFRLSRLRRPVSRLSGRYRGIAYPALDLYMAVWESKKRTYHSVYGYLSDRAGTTKRGLRTRKDILVAGLPTHIPW